VDDRPRNGGTISLDVDRPGRQVWASALPWRGSRERLRLETTSRKGVVAVRIAGEVAAQFDDVGGGKTYAEVALPGEHPGVMLVRVLRANRVHTHLLVDGIGPGGVTTAILKERPSAPETDFEKRFAWWIASGPRQHVILAILTVAWLAIVDLGTHLRPDIVSNLSAADLASACLVIGLGIALDALVIGAVARVIRWLAWGGAGWPGPARPLATLAWVVTRTLGIVMYVLVALSRSRSRAPAAG
jgi:hypothetical protein